MEAEVKAFAFRNQWSNQRNKTLLWNHLQDGSRTKAEFKRERQGVTEEKKDNFSRQMKTHMAATKLQVFTEKKINVQFWIFINMMEIY